MGYDYSNIILTTHAIVRIKQRIKSIVKINEEFMIKSKIVELIEKSKYQFENEENLYILIDNKDLYIVIQKDSLIVKTVMPISHNRMLNILENK